MRKFIYCSMMAACTIFGAYNASKSNKVVMDELTVENIEALGDGGDNASGWKCPGAAQEYVEPNGTYETGRREDGINGKSYTNPGSVYNSYNCMCEKIKYVQITKYCK